MGKRREGREAAVQYLFAHELHGEPSPEEREGFWSLHNAKPGAREYAESLILGTLSHQREIDDHLAAVLENFRIERLANVDRNILRLAVFELMQVEDVPAPVIINEAIEIAKKFGATESGGFVNGILDRLAARVRKAAPSKAPAAPPPSVA